MPTTLLDRLRPVARLAAYQRPQLSKLAGRNERCECADLDDFYHTADIAAFYAFTELGGDPDAPEQFAWDTQKDALLERARIWLAREMQGRQTVYGDFRSRRGPEAGRRGVPPHLAWTSWWHIGGCALYASTTLHTGQSTRVQHHSGYAPEHDYYERQLHGLFAALSAILTPYELWVVEEHHARGRTLRQIAALVAEGQCPVVWRTKRVRDYSGDLGRKRAEKHIQKVYERAIERAAAKLESKWRVLWEDCA